MDSITKIINSELQAQEIIKKARQEAEAIKKETELEGKQIIINAKKEANQELEKFKRELQLQFEQLNSDFDQKNNEIKDSVDNYLKNNLEQLLEQSFKEFLKFIERN